MTNLQAIAARIFKEHGVISCLILHWTFHTASASMCSHFCKAIDCGGTFGPEGNAILVRNMSHGLSDPKELRNPVICGFKLKPALDSHSASKPQRRKQRSVETSDICEPGYSQVNVVKVSRHLM